MKKFLFIALLALVASCKSDDDDACTCYKQYYQFGDKTYREYHSDNCGDNGKVLANSNNLRIVVDCE